VPIGTGLPVGLPRALQGQGVLDNAPSASCLRPAGLAKDHDLEVQVALEPE